jgi:HK97 gp10 family phage protein
MARFTARTYEKSDILQIRVTGLAETMAALGSLSDALASRAVRDAVRAAGEVILAEEKIQVPIGARGQLLESLQVSRMSIRRGERFTVLVGPSVRGFYGLFLEYGTEHFPARPWLRPSVDHAGLAAVDAFRTTLRGALPAAVREVAAP